MTDHPDYPWYDAYGPFATERDAERATLADANRRVDMSEKPNRNPMTDATKKWLTEDEQDCYATLCETTVLTGIEAKGVIDRLCSRLDAQQEVIDKLRQAAVALNRSFDPSDEHGRLTILERDADAFLVLVDELTSAAASKDKP
jgi:hypothetical protein